MCSQCPSHSPCSAARLQSGKEPCGRGPRLPLQGEPGTRHRKGWVVVAQALHRAVPGWGGAPQAGTVGQTQGRQDQSGLTLTKQAHSWLNPCQPVSSQGAAAAGASHTCSSDETLPPGGSQSQQLPVGPRVRPPCPSPRRGPAPATVWAPCGACSGAMAGPPPPRAPLSCCAPSVLSLLPLCSSLSSVPAPYVLAHTGRLY